MAVLDNLSFGGESKKIPFLNGKGIRENLI